MSDYVLTSRWRRKIAELGHVEVAAERWGKREPSPDDILRDAHPDELYLFDPAHTEGWHEKVGKMVRIVERKYARRCDGCDQLIVPTRGTGKTNKRYCGPGHCTVVGRQRKARESKTCEHCQGDFTRDYYESDRQWARRRFCSPACAYKAGVTRPAGSNSWTNSLGAA